MKNKSTKTSAITTIDVTPAKPTTQLAASAPRGMVLGNLALKSCFIADLGDGAYLDASIKIKPNRSGPGFVMKCTDRERLLAGLAKADIDPRLVRVERGRKHWIAFVNQGRSSIQALVKA